jgi:hypothetical protein
MKDMNESYRRGFSEGMKMFGEGGHMGGAQMGGAQMGGAQMGMGSGDEDPRFPTRGPVSMFGGTGGGTGGGGTGGPELPWLAQGVIDNWGPVPPGNPFFDFNGDGIIDGADLGIALTGATSAGIP